MNRREKTLGVLAFLLLLSTALCAGWVYYPYAFPDDVCFSRNGVAVGELVDCREISGQLLEEISEGTPGFLDLAKTRDWLAACQESCRSRNDCSFYVVRSPSSSQETSGSQNTSGHQCLHFE